MYLLNEDHKLFVDQVRKMVADKVAHNPEDVNGVLTNGFYHLYGPINDYAG